MTKKSIKPTPTFNKTKSSTWFAAIPWDEWQDEFNKSVAPNGGRKYKTAWAFAKAKTKDEKERKLIYEAIGPQPSVDPGHKLRVHWLGDWQKERDESFWKKDDKKLAQLQEAWDENVAVRQQLAKLMPYAKRMLNRFARVAEHIDEFYGEQILHEDLTDSQNAARIDQYLKLMERLTKLQRRAMNQYFLSLGIYPGDQDSWGRIAMVALAGEAARQGLELSAGHVEGKRTQEQSADGTIIEGGDLKWVVAATRMIKRKSEAYDLPLPPVDDEVEVEKV